MEEELIRVMLVCSVLLERETLQYTVNGKGGCWIINCAETGREALKNVEENEFDAIWTNILLTDMSGSELYTRTTRLGLDLPFLYHSSYVTNSLIRFVENYGGYGLVTNNCSVNELILAIRTVAKRKKYFPKTHNCKEEKYEQLDILKLINKLTKLNDIEKKILDLLSEGLKNCDIAEKIHRSKKSIDHYNSGLIQKLELRNHNELIVASVKLKQFLLN